MKKVLPYMVLILMIGSILAPVAIGYAQPPNFAVAAGELKVSGYSFTINPSQYTYWYQATETVRTTVRNLSSQDAKFDMGDGTTLTVPANSSVGYEYEVRLKGDTVMIPITKITGQAVGLNSVEQLVLKIEPK